MFNPRHSRTHGPWRRFAGCALVLCTLVPAANAQVRELLVTEVRGNAVRAGAKPAPLRAMETLRVGERVRLSTDTQVGLFNAADAKLYLVEGPTEIAIGGRDIRANGKAVAPTRLHDAYRNVKLDVRDVTQGSLTLRSEASAVRVVSPEGMVAAGEARTFTWKGDSGPWYFEIAAGDGRLVHRERCEGNAYRLPPEVALDPGQRYAWAVTRRPGALGLGDWTEFTIAPAGASFPPSPAATSTVSERVLHAGWLQDRGLERAALRVVAAGR
jgi:hypothetical protein